jgi:hypothetical protein
VEVSSRVVVCNVREVASHAALLPSDGESRWLGRDASKLEVVYAGLEYGDGRSTRDT